MKVHASFATAYVTIHKSHLLLLLLLMLEMLLCVAISAPLTRKKRAPADAATATCECKSQAVKNRKKERERENEHSTLSSEEEFLCPRSTCMDSPLRQVLCPCHLLTLTASAFSSLLLRLFVSLHPTHNIDKMCMCSELCLQSD